MKISIYKLIFILIPVTLILGAEFLPININYYKSYRSNNIHINWKINENLRFVGSSKDDLQRPPMHAVLKYKSIQYGDLEAENPIVVDLSDVDLNFMYLPFCKTAHTNFSKSVTYKHNSNVDLVIFEKDINGDIKFSGSFKYYGILSYTKFKQVVIESMLADVYKEVISKLNP